MASEEEITQFYHFICRQSYLQSDTRLPQVIKTAYLKYLRHLLNTEFEIKWTPIENDILSGRISEFLKTDTFTKSKFDRAIITTILDDIKAPNDKKIQMKAEDKEILLGRIECIDEEEAYLVRHLAAEISLPSPLPPITTEKEAKRQEEFVRTQTSINAFLLAEKYQDCFELIQEILSKKPDFNKEENAFLITTCTTLQNVFFTQLMRLDVEENPVDAMNTEFMLIQVLLYLPADTDSEKTNRTYQILSALTNSIIATETLIKNGNPLVDAKIVTENALDLIRKVDSETLHELTEKQLKPLGINKNNIDADVKKIFEKIRALDEKLKTAINEANKDNPKKRKNSTSLFAAEEKKEDKTESADEADEHETGKRQRTQPPSP